jgi:hypothetical protein
MADYQTRRANTILRRIDHTTELPPLSQMMSIARPDFKDYPNLMRQAMTNNRPDAVKWLLLAHPNCWHPNIDSCVDRANITVLRWHGATWPTAIEESAQRYPLFIQTTIKKRVSNQGTHLVIEPKIPDNIYRWALAFCCLHGTPSILKMLLRLKPYGNQHAYIAAKIAAYSQKHKMLAVIYRCHKKGYLTIPRSKWNAAIRGAIIQGPDNNHIREFIIRLLRQDLILPSCYPRLFMHAGDLLDITIVFKLLCRGYKPSSKDLSILENTIDNPHQWPAGRVNTKRQKIIDSLVARGYLKDTPSMWATLNTPHFSRALVRYWESQITRMKYYVALKMTAPR